MQHASFSSLHAGFFSAFACSTKNSGVTVLKGVVGDGTQNWTVTPLASSNKIEGVRVFLQVCQGPFSLDYVLHPAKQGAGVPDHHAAHAWSQPEA